MYLVYLEYLGYILFKINKYLIYKPLLMNINHLSVALSFLSDICSTYYLFVPMSSILFSIVELDTLKQ